MQAPATRGLLVRLERQFLPLAPRQAEDLLDALDDRPRRAAVDLQVEVIR